MDTRTSVFPELSYEINSQLSLYRPDSLAHVLYLVNLIVLYFILQLLHCLNPVSIPNRPTLRSQLRSRLPQPPYYIPLQAGVLRAPLEYRYRRLERPHLPTKLFLTYTINKIFIKIPQ